MNKHNLIFDVLNDIIITFEEKYSILNRYLTNCSEQGILKFIGNTALFFGRKQFNINTGTKATSLENEEIQIVISSEFFNQFLYYLNLYGLITVKTVLKNILYDDIKIELKLVYDFKKYESHPKTIEYNGFSKYLMKKYFRELGEISLSFCIRVLNQDTTYDEIQKLYLGEHIMAEYISNINMFCFSVVEPKKSKTLTLDLVLESLKSYEEKQLMPYDPKVYNDAEKAIQLRCNGFDMTLIQPLPPKQRYCPEKETCTICLEDIEQNQKCFATNCNHYFHTSCINNFLTKYYRDLYTAVFNGKRLNLEYDIHGNPIRGASYEYSCPNCKNPCFRLDCEYELTESGGFQINIGNPENCIFDNP